MLDPDSIRVVIPSKARPEKCARAAALWPAATVFIPAEDEDAYAEALADVDGAEIVTQPRPARGLGDARRMVMEAFDERCIVQCDDDVRGIMACIGRRHRLITEPAACFQIVYNGLQCADDLGLHAFSLNSTYDLRKIRQWDPFGANRLEAALCGLIGRNEKWWDPRLYTHVDLDISLQLLLEDRWILTDHRFHPRHDYVVAGGAAHCRTSENVQQDYKLLREKWGMCFNVRKRETVWSTTTNVDRKQPGTRVT